VFHYDDAQSVARFGANDPWIGDKADGHGQYYRGYIDEQSEKYVKLPNGVGVVGIARHTAAQPHLLAPPFAIRFDNNGHLRIDGTHAPPAAYARHPNGAGHLFYDGDYNGDWGGGNRWPHTAAGTGTHPRDNGYDPAVWDPEIAGKTQYNPDTDGPLNNTNPQGIFHTKAQKFMLPFDAMETVIGVIAFNKTSLYDQFGKDALKAVDNNNADPPNHGNLRPDVRQWLLENGKVMFFNRYSGAIIKP